MMTREFPRDGRYVVTAPFVMARCMNAWHHLYDGDLVPAGLEPKQRDKLLRLGMISLRPDAIPDVPTTIGPPRPQAYPSVD